ncbi:hypothetical protein K7W42_18635 [Deinococcus sp. HMF7604]|uniref:hypothetical protein n=1 Tax=Deinococcus betulae TaxID=2873312 RepID=UPI001CCF5C13|nr:hypothetical protein [Deinococcus betulae]MBZ9752861.1 hypothetical protein [Deinococcus betulae]
MFTLPDRTPWRQPDPNWTVMDWENAMREALSQPPLSDVMYKAPFQVYGFMPQILGQQPEGELSSVPVFSQVTRRIFVRLMQDLRSVHQLATSGYAAGAGAVASSVSEMAFEVAWVGEDEARAHAWLKHTQRNKPVESFGKRWKEVLRQRHTDPDDQKRAEDFEADIYRSLCMLKHGNSALQKGLSSYIGDGVEYFTAIPMLTANTLYAATFVMFHTTRLCLAAAMDYIIVSRPGTPEDVQELVDQGVLLATQLTQAMNCASHVLQVFDQQEIQREKAWLARDTMTRPVNTLRGWEERRTHAW